MRGRIESRTINSLVASAVIAFLSTFVLFMKYHTRVQRTLINNARQIPGQYTAKLPNHIRPIVIYYTPDKQDKQALSLTSIRYEL